MVVFSYRMSSSGRLRSWSAWVYAENKPLKVLLGFLVGVGTVSSGP